MHLVDPLLYNLINFPLLFVVVLALPVLSIVIERNAMLITQEAQIRATSGILVSLMSDSLYTKV